MFFLRFLLFGNMDPLENESNDFEGMSNIWNPMLISSKNDSIPLLKLFENSWHSKTHSLFKMESDNFVNKTINNLGTLTPKGLRVFLLKTASKQPLLKASWIVQNWNQFWYFQL
jgi:hypothetical protein